MAACGVVRRASEGVRGDSGRTGFKSPKAKFLRVPKFSEVPYPAIMEPNLVIEYYSR